jgi:hypothetical protein
LWDRVFRKIHFKQQIWDAEKREESGNDAFNLLGRYVAWVSYRRFGTTVLVKKVNQSHYRPEVPRGFQEV